MGDHKTDMLPPAIEQITPALKTALDETKDKLKLSDRSQLIITNQAQKPYEYDSVI
jgi:hypothetical protein